MFTLWRRCIGVLLVFVCPAIYAGDIAFNRNVPVAMTDGTTLSGDTYCPDGNGKYPVVLARTPYNKDNFSPDFVKAAVQEGYCVVVQDTRGRNRSEGEFYPFRDEASDGYDTVEWAAEQPWSNGKIGMFSLSYMGVTQWQAAGTRPPSLVAIFPALTASDYHDGWVYRGGALELAFMESWLMRSFVPNLVAKAIQDPSKSAQWFSFLPLSEFSSRHDLFMPKDIAPFWGDFISHPNDGPYWKRWNVEGKYPDITVPAFNVGGWYDIFLTGTLKNFTGMQKHGKGDRARTGQKLLVGPWGHTFLAPDNTEAGEMNFGPSAGLDYTRLQLRWFDYWLKGIDNGIMDEPPVKIFVMGKNEWRDENEWPLARTKYARYYLRDGGAEVNDHERSGVLADAAPGSESPSSYIYDPENPVFTRGGNGCCGSTRVEKVYLGVQDQRPVESRQDVLVFTSDPLPQDMEVTGPVTAVLYASSSALDTDFTAKLIDVHPDGYARNLCDGIMRGRFRDSMSKPELLEPGRVYELRIDLGATSNAFKAGHRIRIHVSSSNFPRFDRNPNTGETFGRSGGVLKATNSIYHDSDHPSHVVLPVIPAGH